jgi:fido (protein-threonine AMPylation protein)
MISFFPISARALILVCWSLAIPTRAHAADAGACPPAFSYLRAKGVAPLSPDATFEEIQAAYQRLGPEKILSIQPGVDGRRIIAPKNWDNNAAAPWLAYGESTMSDWFAALAHVNGLPTDQAATPELLREIHTIATRSHTFHGYEGRRIAREASEGRLSELEKSARLRAVYQENKTWSGTDHRSLAGQYRREPIDEIVHRGSYVSESGDRYFTAKEFAAMRDNPHLRVDAESVRELAPDQIRARVYYTSPPEIPEKVKAVLARGEAELHQEKDPEQILRVILRLQKELVSIHPFLDGNGRTIRLLGDFLRRRHGLPPPLYGQKREMELSIDEMLAEERTEIIQYLNAKLGATKEGP